MPISDQIITNFTGGQQSELIHGIRVDLAKHANGTQKQENFITIPQGGAEKRWGSVYVAAVKDSTKAVRVVPFEFSTTQAYVLEMGDQYFRIYRNNGRVESGGSPVEVVTPYLEADLFELDVYSQSADTLYVCHKNYQPRKITRTGHTTWTISVITFDQPPPNFVSSSNLITNGGFNSDLSSWVDLSVAPNRIQHDGSGAMEIIKDTGNGSAEQSITTVSGRVYELSFLFVDSDAALVANRLISVQIGTATGLDDILTVVHNKIGFITISFTATTANCFIQLSNTFTASTATIDNVVVRQTSPAPTLDANTFPAAESFHQERLVFGGPIDSPNSIFASQTGLFENQNQGRGDDNQAYEYALASNKVDNIVWIRTFSGSLIIGTVGSEWRLSGGALDDPITPGNRQGKPQTRHGSKRVAPVEAGNAILFVQRAGRKLREFVLTSDLTGSIVGVAPDLTLLAENITESGITDLAYQQEPHSLVWGTRVDGLLIAMTYRREENVVAWHPHPMGGTNAIVESVCSIPSADGSRDEVWMVKEQTLNGVTVKSIEYLDPEVYADSAIKLDNPSTISGATQADPVVVTITGHSFLDGALIDIEDIIGMTELNNTRFLVNNAGVNTVELQTEEGVDIDGTAFTPYKSGGKAREAIKILTGLDHLDGETPVIVGNNSVKVSQVVVSGTITLGTDEIAMSKGFVGFHKDSILIPNETPQGSPGGVSLGKFKRFVNIFTRFHKTLGGTVNGEKINLRRTTDPMGYSEPLRSGDDKINNLGSDRDALITIIQDKPLPMTVTGIYGTLDVGTE